MSQPIAQNSPIQITPVDSLSMSHVWYLKQDVANYQPLTLQPEQVFNVYVGLRTGEEYRKRFEQCRKAAEELNAIIQDQAIEIKAYAKTEAKNDKLLRELYDDRDKKTQEIAELKANKTPWYKHPLTYLAAGIVGGIYIAK